MQAQYLTSKGACDFLQCGRSTLTYWRKVNPDFPKPIYVGARSPRYDLADLKAFLTARKASSEAPASH